MADDLKGPMSGTNPDDRAATPAPPAEGRTPQDAGATPPATSKARRWLKRSLVTLLALAIVAGIVGYFGRWEYAYKPGDGSTLNEPTPIPGLAFDVWGRDVSASEADRLRR